MKGGIRCGLGKGAQLSCPRSSVAAYVTYFFLVLPYIL
jgi:hypothetical protein